MEEVFIIVPLSVTLTDVANVLGRSWDVDNELGVPYIEGKQSHAYVVEPELTDRFMEEFFLDEPRMRERLREKFGDFRILALRYRDPALARDMARAIASSELSKTPMLLTADDTYVSPGEFLERLDDPSQWDLIQRAEGAGEAGTHE
jgi:hypothetical protein